MKVVINACFGGFSLSPLAVSEIAKKKGNECYLFTMDIGSNKYIKVSVEEATKAYIFFSYSVNNPQDYRLSERDDDGLFGSANKRAEKIALDYNYLDRHDSDLIEVVGELGEKANGKCAKLKIIEIPDGTDYQICEYDGNEHIAEAHKTWY